MRKALKYQWDGLRAAWYNGLSAEVLRSTIVFFLLALLSFAACMTFPDLRERLLSLVLASIDGAGAVNEDGSLSIAAVLSNNLGAAAFIMVYGLVPFLRLSALPLGLNAMALGVLGARYLAEGYSIAAFLSALLPHGVLELPALFLAFGMGLYVCGHMTRRLFRKDESALHVWDCLVMMSRLLLLVLLPLLAAASVIEAYVTPVIMSFFF